MSEAAVTVAQAARTLSVTPAAVRQWLRRGAPCAAPGGPGRGHGALVVVADLAEWRARRLGVECGGARAIDHVAAGLVDVFRRDGGEGVPLHRSLGISERAAAALLVRAYELIHRRLVGSDAERLPPAIDSIFTVCVPCRQSNESR